MKLYLFGKFGVWSYNQSENDWTSKEIKSHFAKCGEKEQIVVWRRDNLLYYTYYYKFAKNKYCGICVMSDCVLCDFDILFEIFYNSLLEIAKRNVVLSVDKEGNFRPKSKKITDDAMSIDDCFKFLRQSIEQISTEKLTKLNMGTLHTNATAYCNLLVDSNQRVTEAILDSYQVVVVTMGDVQELVIKAYEYYENKEYQNALSLAKKSISLGINTTDAQDIIDRIFSEEAEQVELSTEQEIESRITNIDILIGEKKFNEAKNEIKAINAMNLSRVQKTKLKDLSVRIFKEEDDIEIEKQNIVRSSILSEFEDFSMLDTKKDTNKTAKNIKDKSKSSVDFF